MATILPPEYDFGAALGQGISEGLGNLAQFKLQDIMRRKKVNEVRGAYEKMKPGMGWLADMPESIQKSYLENMYMYRPDIFDDPLTPQKEGIQDFAPYQNAIEAQQMEGQKKELMGQLNGLYPQPGQMNAGRFIGDMLQGQTGVGMPQMGPGAKMMQELQQQESPQQQPVRVTPEMQKSGPLTKRYSVPAGLTPAQRANYLKDIIKQEKAEVSAAEKDAKPVIKEVTGKYKAALDDEMSLKRMEQLINTKELTRPRFRSFLNTLEKGLWGVGINLHSLETPESHEFDKLSKNMMRHVKDIFGSKVTNLDVENFLKTIPDLTQTREGKRRIIYNMRLLNEGTKVRKETMDKIIEENNGVAPKNLESLIEKRAKPQLDDIAKRFVEGMPEKKKKEGVYMPKFKNPISSVLNFALGKG